MPDPFVHLHVASGYSLRYGASLPHVLVERAAEHGMDSLALTDRDGLYGAVRFAKACHAYGVRPLFGVDLALHPETRTTKAKTPARGGARVDQRLARVVLLAEDQTGWAHLCRLVSAVHLGGERGTPIATREVLARHAEGLVLLLGPDSDVGRALTARAPARASALLQRWRESYSGAQLVGEVVHQRARGERGRAERWLGFLTDAGVPTVLTNAVRYADRSAAPVIDVLDASRRLVALDPRHVDRENAEGYLKSGKEMGDLALELTGSESEARRLLSRTRALADRCAVDLGLGEVHFPELRAAGSVAGGGAIGTAAQVSADAVLRERCIAGFNRRGVTPTKVHHDRLDEELAVIAQLGYPTYFLTVADVVDLIKEMGIRCAARGSGAGSYVNYLLGISDVDAIEHRLLMERFLSPLRKALPDVDVDVESARRLEVYDAILAKYGDERVACVAMVDTYRVRHAIRDVGAALGLPPPEIDMVAKSFPHIRANQVHAALQDLPELRASRLEASRLGLLFDLVAKLDGLPRHLALHPCGVLLSDATLLDRTPVESSFLGYPMSQFDKDDVEDLGLLKLDVLGIRLQSSMAHAIDEIERVDGVRVDIDAVPRDDPATWRLVRSTRTLGCFQIESPGQRELIGKFGPETFADLIIDISLFRPGPVKSDMVTPFLRARQGWDPVRFPHPSLADCLQQTYGVVVFHEQVLEIVATITGCSLAEADEIRRKLGDPEEIDGIRLWFCNEALRRGYDTEDTQKIWRILKEFAAFGFCKAHAAAFALPTYQSAWLKAHHTAAFLAGVLTHDPGMYPKRLILDDARQFGIAILPLDVNASAAAYTIERMAAYDEPPPGILGARPEPEIAPDASRYGVRLGLDDVKGITEAEVAGIVAGRPFGSLADFWHRAGVSRPVVERLVTAGGFDSIYGLGAATPVRRRGRVTRRDLLLQVAELDTWSRGVRRGIRRPKGDTNSSQLALDLGDDPSEVRETGLPEMTPGERVRAELEVLGLDASQHVLHAYEPFFAAAGLTRSRDLLRCRSQAEVLVAGVKVATQTPPIRSGRRVVFVTLDDATGPVDATFFEDAQVGYASTVFHSWLLVIRGVIRRTGPRGVSVRALGAWELPMLYRAWTTGGLDAVRALMDTPPLLLTEASVEGAAESRSTRPVMVAPPGYRMSPYMDLQPPGEYAKTAPRRLWHSSQGSSGG